MGDLQSAAQTIRMLKGKALGFIEGIQKMGTEEQMRTVGLATAQDYDRFVDALSKAVPELGALAPPRTTQFQGDTRRHVRDTYAEILIRAEQIYHMLDGLEDDTGPDC